MLYLTRKIGETIIINGTIEVTVVESSGSAVKLGFNFPKEATVLRKEIHDKIMQENIAASSGNRSYNPLDVLKKIDLKPHDDE